MAHASRRAATWRGVVPFRTGGRGLVNRLTSVGTVLGAIAGARGSRAERGATTVTRSSNMLPPVVEWIDAFVRRLPRDRDRGVRKAESPLCAFPRGMSRLIGAGLFLAMFFTFYF